MFGKANEVYFGRGIRPQAKRSEAPHLHYEIQVKGKDGQWTKINPVVGETEKVNVNDNVKLKDPQKMIDKRDGVNESSPRRKTSSSIWKRWGDAMKAIDRSAGRRRPKN
ncbi:MAG: hypothetical protein AAF696_31690 [Bacteroidota bacterium]